MARFGRKSKSKGDSISLTGLFSTKREGLHTGKVDGEYLDRLIDVIKKARAKKAGLTFFLWENDSSKAGDFGLSVGVTTPYEPNRAVRRKPIEPDPDFGDDDETEEDDEKLFEDD